METFNLLHYELNFVSNLTVALELSARPVRSLIWTQ